MSQIASTTGNENSGILEQKTHILNEKLHAIKQVEELMNRLNKYR